MRADHQLLVSVCIPVYNGEKYITETIQSVLAQTYLNIEILVQDNASTDSTGNILHEIAKNNSKVSIVRNAHNCGMASNWNLVVNRASGDYIVLLSADDLLLPRFIEECILCFGRRKVDVVTTNHFYLKEGLQQKRKLKLASGMYEEFSGLVLLKNPFSINFSMFSRELVNRTSRAGNLFSRSLYTCDYDLWIRLSLSGEKVFYLDEFLGIYRLHDENLSRQTARMYRQAALVVLAHKDRLKASCPLAYCLTLVRFLLRNLKSKYMLGTGDRRLLNVILMEIIRCAR